VKSAKNLSGSGRPSFIYAAGKRRTATADHRQRIIDDIVAIVAIGPGLLLHVSAVVLRVRRALGKLEAGERGLNREFRELAHPARAEAREREVLPAHQLLRSVRVQYRMGGIMRFAGGGQAVCLSYFNDSLVQSKRGIHRSRTIRATHKERIYVRVSECSEERKERFAWRDNTVLHENILMNVWYVWYVWYVRCVVSSSLFALCCIEIGCCVLCGATPL
jgi:hypothetical protein